MSELKFSDWEKIDLRVAQIIKVEDIEGADKLYKLTIDLGKELGKRIICAGIKEYYKSDDLKGKRIIVLANLESRKLRGIDSKGMLLAADNKEAKTCVLIVPEKDVPRGTKIS